METTKTRFKFDGHLHIPSYRIEASLASAMENGLDAVIFTDYRKIVNFYYLTNNKDEEGNSILTKNKWDIRRISRQVLKILNKDGEIYVIKGEEIPTKQGHLLAWGIEERIEEGLDIEETLCRVYKQNGIAIFPHLFNRMFRGCGKEVFENMYKKFSKSKFLLGLEQNGQIPKIFGDYEMVRGLADEYGVACFGNSDIHGGYLWEHKKIGKRLYSSIPKEYVDIKNFIESLGFMMGFNQEIINIEGETNSLLETILWNIDSLRKNGREKLADLLYGAKVAFKSRSH